MAEVILMPRLSDTMTEGVIASWQKKVGDPVKKGDVLAEIETDKATMELESYKDGILLHTGGDPGSKLQVNDLLAIIGQKGEDISGLLKEHGGAQAPASAKATADTSSPVKATADTQVSSAQGGREAVPEHEEVEVEETTSGNGRIKASPLAKRLASERGIDLRKVHGTGDGGRITKEDIDNFVQPAAKTSTVEEKPAEQKQKPEAPKYVPAAVTGKESFDEVQVSQMRKVIAKRLAESKFSAPHFYLTMSIDMDKAVASRDKLNEVSPVKISFNDFVIKAVALSLRQHPAVNSSWLGDKIRRNHHVHIGVAVAVEDGLLVPVIRFADSKTLSQIAYEVKDLAGKAKSKKLQPNEWEGNTFTISNLGMFGIDEFTGIINPPDACILAVGAIQQIPVVRNGEIKIGNVMKVTMSCDHRVVDGATGSAFLQTLKGMLEEPLRMLV